MMMKNKDRISTKVVRAAGASLAVGSAMLAATELPGLFRYLKLKRMAKHDGHASRMPDPENVSNVQAPRRVEDKPHDEAIAKRRR
jgi:hypothetical protein